MVVATYALIASASSTAAAIAAGCGLLAELAKKKECLGTLRDDFELSDGMKESLAMCTKCLVWRGAAWWPCMVVIHGDLLVVTPERFFPEVAIFLCNAFIALVRSTVKVTCEARTHEVQLLFHHDDAAATWTMKAREAAAASSNLCIATDLAQHRQRFCSTSGSPKSKSTSPTRELSFPETVEVHQMDSDGESTVPEVVDTDHEVGSFWDESQWHEELRKELRIPKRVEVILMTPRDEVWPSLTLPTLTSHGGPSASRPQRFSHGEELAAGNAF